MCHASLVFANNELLSIIAGHDESPADTIQDVGNVVSYLCTYKAVICTDMFMTNAFMYVYVHTMYMHVCTCIFI